jgi:hypothetical protein
MDKNGKPEITFLEYLKCEKKTVLILIVAISIMVILMLVNHELAWNSRDGGSAGAVGIFFMVAGYLFFSVVHYRSRGIRHPEI